MMVNTNIIKVKNSISKRAAKDEDIIRECLDMIDKVYYSYVSQKHNLVFRRSVLDKYEPKVSILTDAYKVCIGKELGFNLRQDQEELVLNYLVKVEDNEDYYNNILEDLTKDYSYLQECVKSEKKEVKTYKWHSFIDWYAVLVIGIFITGYLIGASGVK